MPSPVAREPVYQSPLYLPQEPCPALSAKTKVLQPHSAFRSLGWDTRPAQTYPEPILGGAKTLQAHEKRSAVMGKQITH